MEVQSSQACLCLCVCVSQMLWMCGAVRWICSAASLLAWKCTWCDGSPDLGCGRSALECARCALGQEKE